MSSSCSDGEGEEVGIVYSVGGSIVNEVSGGEAVARRGRPVDTRGEEKGSESHISGELSSCLVSDEAAATGFSR